VIGGILGSIADYASNNPQNNATGTPAAAVPGSDRGMGSDNATRLPTGAGPGGTRVKNTFAGANPLTTSGFPVGHPSRPADADVVAAAITGGNSNAPTTVGKKKKPPVLGGGGLATHKLGA
tara:strand:- start:4983 stop:5345 length:363 start_codon:yes stop_codon:yes gene_type:complete